MAYLHGIEIKEITEGSYPIRVVNSAVVGLVGTAIKGPVNEPTLITSMKSARDVFGEDVGGLTIVAALETIFANGGATCVVVNVAETATLTSKVLTGGKVKKVSGKWVTKIYDAAISGDGDFSAKVVSGCDKLLESEGKFGLKPKILIAPGYSQLTAVLGKLVTVANRLRAKAVVDIVATNVANALTKRGSTYSTGDNRVLLAWPQVDRYNAHEKESQPAGLSTYVAAAIASRDANEGYWYSPSNYELKGLLGSRVLLSSSIEDEHTDTNQLNSKGIITLFRVYGTGYRVWGNWTAAFPTDSNVTAMIAPSRTRDVLDESVQQASLQFMDGPINQAMIDSIRQSVNEFIRTLIGRGAIVDGSCTYVQESNPASEVAQGKLRFRVSFAPSPSLDRLTFESFVDINLLNSLT